MEEKAANRIVPSTKAKHQYLRTWIIGLLGISCIYLQVGSIWVRMPDNAMTDMQMDTAHDVVAHWRPWEVHTNGTARKSYGPSMTGEPHSVHDSRYFNITAYEEESMVEEKLSLLGLLSSYFEVMDRLGVDATWLAGPTLSDHLYGQHLMPWPSLRKVEISQDELRWLVENNRKMTKTVLALPRHLALWSNRHPMNRRQSKNLMPRMYLLDIDPLWWTLPSHHLNQIDARWIDTSNGRYLNVIGVSNAKGEPHSLSAKDGTFYNVSVYRAIHDMY